MSDTLVRISSVEFFRVCIGLRWEKALRVSETNDPDVVATGLRRGSGRKRSRAGPVFNWDMLTNALEL
jgi:hypothetical protein